MPCGCVTPPRIYASNQYLKRLGGMGMASLGDAASTATAASTTRGGRCCMYTVETKFVYENQAFA